MGEQRKIREEFPDEKLMALEVTDLPWYADIVNYLVSGLFSLGETSHQGRILSTMLGSTYGISHVY